ncbi:MAG TPA: GntR family transcriptional regulator [Candidatus Dormibacteraeota bacterium]|nr:GntR family transcriptional regulator [Candidatus Dormibacteraeota bacterium]
MPELRQAVLADLILDRASPVPLYHQIVSRIEGAIERGELQAGVRLDNEVDIARQLGLSRPTLRMAIARLVDKGLLIRRRGVGTIVAPAHVRRPFALTSLYDDLVAAGKRPVTQVLSFQSLTAPEWIARELRAETGVRLLYIRRLRTIDGEPIAVMTNYLPEGVLRAEAHELEESGLYLLLRRRGIQPRIANQTVGARLASGAEARLLAVRRGAPLLTMNRTAFDDAGQPVELGLHIYPAERYSLEMTVVRH